MATEGFGAMVAAEARRVTDAKVVTEIAALCAKSGWPARPDDSGTDISAPFNAPTLGPPPWFVHDVKPHTAPAVGTTDDGSGNALALPNSGAFALVLIAGFDPATAASRAT